MLISGKVLCFYQTRNLSQIAVEIKIQANTRLIFNDYTITRYTYISLTLIRLCYAWNNAMSRILATCQFLKIYCANLLITR